MPSTEYTEIIVEEDILPQVLRELTILAEDQNHVEVTHGVAGRVVLVHPDLAEAWYQKVTTKADVLTEATAEAPVEATVPAPAAAPDEVLAKATIPVPVKREPGRPRTIQPAPSVSNGEES